MKLIESLNAFLQDEQGQSMVEYGVLIGSVASATYVGVEELSDSTRGLFHWAAQQLPKHEADEFEAETATEASNYDFS